MRSILFELGPLKIHAYGTALALAFLVGSIWVTRRGTRRGFLEEDLMRLFWWILISALIGSRLYYALQHPADFRENWLGVSQLWRGGLTQYGGLIAATLVAALFIRARGWSFLEVADLVAPALALGEAITRIGCFFNGCCFGRACDLPWAVSFPEGSHAHWVLGDTPIHPSQLYLMLGNLILFGLLAPEGRLERRPGRLFAAFLAGSSFIRILVDATRYYEAADRIAIFGLDLPHSQWVSVAFIIVALVLWFMAPEKKDRGERAAGNSEEDFPPASTEP